MEVQEHTPTWKKRRKLILPQNKRPGYAVFARPLSCLAYFDASSKSFIRRRRLPEGYPSYRYARTATAAQEYRQPDPKPVKVHVHADMLKITYTDRAKGKDDRASQHSGGKRGTITGFSRASRKRMFEFMASVRSTGSMLFLTMTFDDTTALNSDEWMLEKFEAFRRRFERQYPKWRALWRKEWQDRKSGDLLGTFVPHYHMIIFTGVHYEKEAHEAVCEEFSAWGSDAWHEITASVYEAHTVYGFHVTPVRSRRHAYAYVGKYVGKANSHDFSPGRCWGRIGKFDCSASETFALDADEYIALRRLIKKWLKTRAQIPAPDAPPEEVEKWLQRERKQRQYARKFSRQSARNGCSIFGIGDTTAEGTDVGIFGLYWQMVTAAKSECGARTASEDGTTARKTRSRSHFRNLQ